MKKIIEKRKDIAFLIKMFPLPFHKGADVKSKAIVCEKSIALLEAALEKKPVPAPKCETKAIEENIKLAEELGIRGTPAIILSNGTTIPGYKDADSLIALIDKQASK
jgi:thiol:disulfide interchange protein DsbC